MKYTIWIVGLFILISLSNSSEASSSKKDNFKYKMAIKSLFKKMIEKTRLDGRIDVKSEGINNQFFFFKSIT
jgi:hypothetical protein